MLTKSVKPPAAECEQYGNLSSEDFFYLLVFGICTIQWIVQTQKVS